MIHTTAPVAPKNPGIVPPWLQPVQKATNPGTVPPWLETQISPLGVAGGETQFVPQSTTISPMSFVDALRNR
ncbi:MAG: hypothetical protein JWN72_2955 [Thermoleophilia bacterium]|nr:hypothetical protein [Thermoleophilia bacterium]